MYNVPSNLVPDPKLIAHPQRCHNVMVTIYAIYIWAIIFIFAITTFWFLCLHQVYIDTSNLQVIPD